MSETLQYPPLHQSTRKFRISYALVFDFLGSRWLHAIMVIMVQRGEGYTNVGKGSGAPRVAVNNCKVVGTSARIASH